VDIKKIILFNSKMEERERPTLRRICPLCSKRYKTKDHMLKTIMTLKKHGWSYREIGDMMHISHMRVYDHYKRCLNESIWKRLINFLKFWRR